MKKSISARNVQRHRDRMRSSGLKLVQVWVPDSRAPGFAEECRRQSRSASRSRVAERKAMAWVDATRDTKDWTA